MHEIENRPERRTSADVVFEQLHEEIVSLQLLPGTKLSEAELARRFGVSRQPIRDAFNRLDNLDLLLIRPQKATEVRGFSIERIAHSRFVRLAIELEVITRACAVWDKTRAKTLQKNIDLQQKSIESNQSEKFHLLDAEFHRLICELGGSPTAAVTIQSCKKNVDRLCTLSLSRDCETSEILEDHEKIAAALKKGNVAMARKVVRKHCGRLDETISSLHSTHADYFELS